VLGDAELWIAEIDDADPTRLISAASRIAVPELSWELDGANVVEAPFVIARDGRIHLTYSASAVGPSYAVGELVADVGDDLLDPSSWRKSPFPLLDSDPSTGQWGPGHSMFARVGETDLVVYHALAAPSATIRDSAIRPVRFGANGRLVLDARSGRAEGVQGG
jgi:GH43 family beta-xylosidase